MTSNTGPVCHIEEIDDYQGTTVQLLKEAVSQCLDLPEWVNLNHIMLYFKGNLLTNENECLEAIGIKDGS